MILEFVFLNKSLLFVIVILVQFLTLRTFALSIMLHTVILAGGAGTRLWPASRTDTPKYMLVFEENQTLLQAALARIANLTPPERTWIITNQSQTQAVANSLPQFDAAHILKEPEPRNTAASIGLTAIQIRRIDPDAVLAVLPADHIIKPASIFCETIRHAAELVEAHPETLITIGVKPTFPATSYGYIQRGEPLDTPFADRLAAHRVRQFREKPRRETAEQFCQSDEYYWNAGLFVWRADTILNLLHRFEPAVGNSLRLIEQSLGTEREPFATERAFKAMKSISIDYAVMERAENIIVLEAAFEWNDIGTWSALDRIYADKKDEQGNIAVASKVLAIDSTRCTVRCDDSKHLIALVGMHDIVVIHTAEATLIVNKEQEESVRRVVQELEREC